MYFETSLQDSGVNNTAIFIFYSDSQGEREGRLSFRFDLDH